LQGGNRPVGENEALEQRTDPRLGHCLGAAAGPELAEEVADVFFHGVQGNHQRLSNLLIGGAGSQQAQDFLFPPGE
jgi:hypothetical protein